jgi:hypothetical protein
MKARSHLGGPATPIDVEQRRAVHSWPHVKSIDAYSMAPTSVVPGRLLLALGDVSVGV